MFSASKTSFLLIIAVCAFDFSRGLAINDYLEIREKAINDEETAFFGGNLQLEKDEVIANECLVSLKQREIDEGYQNLSKFWQSRDFLEVREDIERTEIFKIIRLMPKGAVLHVHLGKTASLKFVYENLTTLPNLYVCFDNNTVKFQFFDNPNKSCDWLLMQDLRARNPEVIENIKKQLTLLKLSTPGYNTDVFWARFGKLQQAFDGIVKYRPAYEMYLQRALEELYEDNIMYLEVRSFPDKLYELNGTINDPVVAFTIFKRVIDNFVASHPGFLGVKYIYSVGRQLSHEEFNAEAEAFRRIVRIFPDFVIGFDISNYEDRGHPNVYFIDKLLELSNETTFYFHVGETKWFGHPVDENVFDAVLLNSKRIGHGNALIKHPELLEMVKEKDIAIEVNPISTQLVGDLKDLRNHPASHYFAKNLSVVVSSDAPSFWLASGLSYDFYEAFIGIMSRKADLRSLKQLAINSITYSAMTRAEKEAAFKVWNQSWKTFIKYLAYEYKCDQKH